MARIVFWMSEIVVLAVVAFPIIGFLCFQWPLRKLEFSSSIGNTDLSGYLGRFYARSVERQMSPKYTFLVNQNPELRNEIIFDWIYNRTLGRPQYIFPSVLLILSLALSAGPTLATAYRSAYEQYSKYYQSVHIDEKMDSANQTTTLTGSHDNLVLSKQFEEIVWPFGWFPLTLPTVAAICGAYIYVASTTIQGFRSRSLVRSDLMRSTLRIVIAPPLGMIIGAATPDKFSAFCALGLLLLPLGEIASIFKRILSGFVFVVLDGREKATWKVTRIFGVTREISTILYEEGIGSIQQLSCHDPVTLSIRSGLTFDFILNIVSQAQTWSLLGDLTGNLAELGFSDSRFIWKFVQKYDKEQRLDAQGGSIDPPSESVESECRVILTRVTERLQKTMIDEKTLLYLFRSVAEDPYTKFLTSVSRVHDTHGKVTEHSHRVG